MMGKSVFEGYWLDDRVGEGAFGTVYRIVKQDETGTYTRALKEITIPTDAQYQEVLSSMGGDRRRTDQYFEEVRDEMIDFIKEEKGENGKRIFDLIMVTKYLERIGDHATNIAEWVEFSITGVHKDSAVIHEG